MALRSSHDMDNNGRAEEDMEGIKKKEVMTQIGLADKRRRKL